MQVIEKVKVVPEGYNGAGMDGYGRRDVNGKANAGLTLGIIGTALGAWALFGNRRSTGVLGTGAGLMGDGSTNINDFLARGGRGRSGRGGRGRGMMNRIGYKTYDNYDRDEQRGYGERHRYDESRGYDGSHGYDEEERMLLMQMLGVDGNERYNDYGDEHFNKQEAKRTVDEMYHVKDGKKYIGEKYDMQKAHEVCSKFKDKLEEDIEVADVYVAINAQYHDYCELFEKWFGKGNFDEMIFESAIAFWFDDVDFGEDKLWKYFNELK